MNRWANVLGIMVLMGMCVTVAQAKNDKEKNDKAKPGKASVGTITAVAADQSSFTVKMGEAEESHKRTFKVTEATKFEIDGKSATAAEVLVVGTRVKVRYEGDTALSVAVKTKDQGKDGDNAGKDKGGE